jgi:HEAT repeat protein
MTLDDQIHLACRGTKGAEAALAEILAGGEAAVAALIATIERGPGSIVAAEILGFVQFPDRLAVLDRLATHPAYGVRRAAIRLLGQSGDPRAMSSLERIAPTSSEQVVAALGDLGLPEGAAIVRGILAKTFKDLSIDTIRQRAIEDCSSSLPILVARCVEALAKLGDFSLVDVALRLARYRVDEPDETDAFMVRQAAIAALDVSIGPGIATTLEQCYEDPVEDDVVWVALEAMLHLGRPEAVDRWIELLDSDRTGVQHTALSCIERLVGEKPSHIRDRAKAWWRERLPRFDPAICYRAGEPATPAPLVRAARGRNSRVSRRDLRQMAGLAFITPMLDPPAMAETHAIDAWWAAHEPDFVPGKLHRWGRSYDPAACD